ncbi:hypothetical protein [Streptomyces diastatochromogenes]|uniref:Uncharacterized protein n=1 Tax=Streptomyces diastatochromogenes TaxID=42236 RepID=A0A233SXD5_STRDA|nr:hypothetical protein [Streptomyces diastatochromogenes]MCZ0990312.1 hypothetical protein [Streptomyces diastatochromogenes]OXZ00304.1 hypothetical protein BEK98_00935 [Streptomyces diastatochromogenes]
MSSSTTGLVPVHIGQPEPGSEEEQGLLLRRERALNQMGPPEPLRVPGDVPWEQHGLVPRWWGMESSDCPAAVEPGFFSGQGHEEFERFLGGARQRGEVALVFAVVGHADGDRPRNPLSSVDASVRLGDQSTSAGGRRLPKGMRPEIAPGLEGADRDLALRLLTRPEGAPWWSLKLYGSQSYDGYRSGRVDHPAAGELHPILVDSLGEPVVAAWTPPEGDQRWYLIPDATRWESVLGWLVHRALPKYVPAALRRARSPFFIDPDLQTVGEQSARDALEDLEARYAAEKHRLEDELRQAKETAEPVRYGLLYGSGTDLVHAVARVLTAAGMHTVDLDEELGGTKSADLLVGADGMASRLVEVKGASGPAQEHLVGHLQRHLETWPQLRPDEPVSDGVLIVNHQHKLHPSERTAAVYARPEFVASLDSLPVTVISTVELFNWWRAADWAAIRTAVLGDAAVTAQSAAPVNPPQPPSAQRRRWWSGGRHQ